MAFKHGEDTLTANVGSDYSYTLTEAGNYSYSVTFGEDSRLGGLVGQLDRNGLLGIVFAHGKGGLRGTAQRPLTTSPPWWWRI